MNLGRPLHWELRVLATKSKRGYFLFVQKVPEESIALFTFLVLIWPHLISDSVIVDIIKNCISDQLGDINVVNLPVQIKTEK